MVLSSACGGRQSSLRPKIAERDWHVVSSPHFELTTDLSPAQIEKFIFELEQLWWTLSETSTLVVAKQALPTEKFYMVHLASCDDFRAVIWSPGIAGYVANPRNFQRRRTMVTCHDGPSGREVLTHKNGTSILLRVILTTAAMANRRNRQPFSDSQG
ncbi:MAG: hypothetical protein GY811_18495 [Myxococcales bacterium]|nr:hypothetical protein [Myxococcales bacterium]